MNGLNIMVTLRVAVSGEPEAHFQLWRIGWFVFQHSLQLRLRSLFSSADRLRRPRRRQTQRASPEAGSAGFQTGKNANLIRSAGP
ncbi:MAG: hypothetical protein ACREEK_07875 [Bradyrhizobium sp.]